MSASVTLTKSFGIDHGCHGCSFCDCPVDVMEMCIEIHMISEWLSVTWPLHHVFLKLFTLTVPVWIIIFLNPCHIKHSGHLFVLGSVLVPVLRTLTDHVSHIEGESLCSGQTQFWRQVIWGTLVAGYCRLKFNEYDCNSCPCISVWMPKQTVTALHFILKFNLFSNFPRIPFPFRLILSTVRNCS